MFIFAVKFPFTKTINMANNKTTMTDLRIIISELAKGTSKRKISRDLHISRTSIDVYEKRADESGYPYEELLSKTDKELFDILRRPDGHRKPDEEKRRLLEPRIAEYAERLSRKHVTFEVIYDEYCTEYAYSYSYTQFKEIIKAYCRAHDYSFHNVYHPGDEMQADFAGDPLWIYDGKTDVATKAYVLVCVLPYSQLSFACAMTSTRMEYFFDGMSKALEYFQGVPSQVKSDNMSQWVKKYDRYEPTLTEAANQWGLYYGTDIENCRVAHPRDKGPAESLVNQVYRYVYARIENGRGDGHREIFHSLDELNSRIMELMDQYNHEKMKGRNCSRWEKYEESERYEMLPITSERFTFKYEKEFIVNATYHVSIGKEKHFYSIPYQYVNQKAKAVYDCNTVEIWVNMNRVSVHVRKLTDGYSTIPEHMPERHREYLRRTRECNAAYFLDKAAQIGPNTRDAVQAILESKPFLQQSYKACQGVLSLCRRFGAIRLEKVCAKLEDKHTANYLRLKNMLENSLDLAEQTPASSGSYMPRNEDVRGAEAYQ